MSNPIYYYIISLTKENQPESDRKKGINGMNSIGKIERVALREVWQHEASNFTPWLQKNIEVLNEILDLELTNPETEQPAGSFSVDMVVEDQDGKTVVIENQLERSNHDHLGKVITYLSAYEAKAAIWIVSDAHPAHINAISWLNESISNVSFYLVKVEAVIIGGSEPAALFTLIVGPSEEGRIIGKKKMEMAESNTTRDQFWSDLIAHINTKTPLHANLSPPKSPWFDADAGMTGLTYTYWIRKKDSQVQLWIVRGKGLGDINSKIYDALIKYREKIEENFGANLEWVNDKNRPTCKIVTAFHDGGLRDKSKWPEIQSNMCDTMISFEKAFRPFINKIKNQDF